LVTGHPVDQPPIAGSIAIGFFEAPPGKLEQVAPVQGATT